MTASGNDPGSHQRIRSRRAVLEPPVRFSPEPGPRLEAKRARIIDAALQHFAEQGYHAARIEDLAAQLGFAKGSIFQYFGSKAGLFLETYKKAVKSFPAYLDCPANILEKGFFEIVRYWLLGTQRLLGAGWISHPGAPLWNFWAAFNFK